MHRVKVAILVLEEHCSWKGIPYRSTFLRQRFRKHLENALLQFGPRRFVHNILDCTWTLCRLRYTDGYPNLTIFSNKPWTRSDLTVCYLI